MLDDRSIAKVELLDATNGKGGHWKKTRFLGLDNASLDRVRSA